MLVSILCPLRAAITTKDVRITLCLATFYPLLNAIRLYYMVFRFFWVILQTKAISILLLIVFITDICFLVFLSSYKLAHKVLHFYFFNFSTLSCQINLNFFGLVNLLISSVLLHIIYSFIVVHSKRMRNDFYCLLLIWNAFERVHLRAYLLYDRKIPQNLIKTTVNLYHHYERDNKCAQWKDIKWEKQNKYFMLFRWPSVSCWKRK